MTAGGQSRRRDAVGSTRDACAPPDQLHRSGLAVRRRIVLVLVVVLVLESPQNIEDENEDDDEDEKTQMAFPKGA